MTKPNDAAFPVTSKDEHDYLTSGWGSIGLTKREHTAIEMAKAMIGTAAGPVTLGLDGAEHVAAKAAIRMADALLEELGK